MTEKVSIYDIADYCNISAASVSYCINGKKKVSEATKKRVFEAIKVLGYHPNYTARALSTGKSNLIGIMLPLHDPSIAFLQNPFYVEFMGGFEKSIAKFNYDMVISSEYAEMQLEDWIRRRSVDGLILIGNHQEKIYQILRDLQMPTVLIDDESEHSKYFNNVRSNDEEGMYLATKHLIENGHIKIAFIGNKDKYLIDAKRYKGYVRALEECNINVDESLIYEADATFDDGIRVGKNIIDNQKVTACVCVADIIAIGIIKAFEEHGLKVPDDLSVVGFDDIQSAAFISPSLTTIHQKIGSKGTQAANIFFDIFENKDLSQKNISLETYLVKRNSVKNLKENS